MMLVRHCQFLATLGAAGCQNAAAVLCSHSLTEAVLVHSSSVVRLKCSFHCSNIILLLLFRCLNKGNTARNTSQKTHPGTEMQTVFTLIWGAKVLILFQITKNYAIFSLIIYVFFYKFRNFAAHLAHWFRQQITISR